MLFRSFIVTDTYRRTGGSADSERLLFYVDNTTKQIVYRKQLDRFTIEYTLPDAPQDVVELIKVSKNIYGGITALYCYDDGAGGLLTGSFTAMPGVDTVAIGTDNGLFSSLSLIPTIGTVANFLLKQGSVPFSSKDEGNLVPSTASIIDFVLRLNIVNLQEQTSSGSMTLGTGTVSDFSLKSVINNLEEQTSNGLLAATTATVLTFLIKTTVIEISQYGIESAELVPTSGTIISFTLG